MRTRASYLSGDGGHKCAIHWPPAVLIRTTVWTQVPHNNLPSERQPSRKPRSTKFQNLLSMKPVFDADGIYRYVIGVQFEVVEDMNLKARLVQLDKLLRLLPSKLPGLRSKSKARAKGNLAARVTGEANTRVAKKDAVMKYEQKQAASDAQAGPRLLEDDEEEAPAAATLDYSMTVFHFTRIYWLQRPLESIRGILSDPFGIDCCYQFASCACSELLRHHVLFCKDALELQKYDKYNGARDKMLYKFHKQLLYHCHHTLHIKKPLQPRYTGRSQSHNEEPDPHTACRTQLCQFHTQLACRRDRTKHQSQTRLA